MKRSFRGWLGWFIFLLVLDLVIPWAVLSSMPKTTGALLFWPIWVFVAIISCFILFLKWKEVD